MLTRFNFRPSFRQWVNIVYTDTQSCVLHNGWLLAKIKLDQGVRQGCPLSPLLYCLVAETLGQAIRRDNSIPGIPIPGVNKQSKVSQYADDTTLILAENYTITQSFNFITIFERGSGSHLNAKKTEGLWLGSITGKQTGPVNITCTTDKLKTLGVYFGTSNVEHANWIERIIKLAVINPSEKVRALKLRWVPQIGDLSCMSNWVFFARYWVALALSCKVPSWTFLRSNACPTYIGDSPSKYFTHILTGD